MLRPAAVLAFALAAGCTAPAPPVQAAAAEAPAAVQTPPPPPVVARSLPRRVNTRDGVVTCTGRPDFDAYTTAVRERGAELSDLELGGMGLTCVRGILWPESEFAVLDSASAPHAVQIRVYAITGVEVDVWAPGVVLEP